MKLNIKEIRINLGLTQKDLGEISNLSRSYISKIEKNTPEVIAGLTLKTIKKIAIALDVNPQLLINWENKKARKC